MFSRLPLLLVGVWLDVQKTGQLEKEFLFELVSTQINVVKDKRRDNNAHKKQKAEWKHIYEQFVVRYEGTGHDVARLKEQWKQMKATAKKEVSDF